MTVLEEQFVNTWIVAKDLAPLAAEAEDEAVRKMAALAESSYLYPVDSQVYSPDGKLLDHACANDMSRLPDRTGRYLELLGSASIPETDEDS